MKTPEEVASAVADELQMIGRPRWPQEIAMARAGMIEALDEAIRSTNDDGWISVETLKRLKATVTG